MTDRAVPLEQLWDANLAAAVRDGRLNEVLLDRVRMTRSDWVDTAVTAIERDHSLRVDELSARLGIVRQHLTREFRRVVGVGPKAFARTLRFHRVLASCTSEERPSWSGVAVECGYYDQAHMVAEFKSMTGLTPERLRRTRATFHSSNTEAAETA